MIFFSSWVKRLRGFALVFGCVVVAAGGFTSAQAADDPPGRVGRVVAVLGSAWLQDDDQSEWTAVPRNQPLTRGDRLMTEADSRLEVQVGSTWLRLDGRTELFFSRLDDDQVAVRVLRGSVALRIRQPEVLRDWSLDTADGSLLPLSTGHFRLDLTSSGPAPSVISGEARFVLGSSSLTLRAGQRAELDASAGRSLQARWLAMADDDFERWLRHEDDNQAAWVGRDSLSPEMTGIQDLDRYGRWDQHSEHGAIWSPSVVPAGWAPYRHGRWAWVAPWGWSWVDDAPWGFAPSHYGRWLHWSGRWCWAPGPYVRRPVYAPALVAWVGGGNWSVSVSSGPLVSWVPLAPREAYRPHHPASSLWVTRVNAPHHDPRRDHFGGHEDVRFGNRGAPGGLSLAPEEHFRQRRPVVPVPRWEAPSHRGGPATHGVLSPVIAPPAPQFRSRPGDGGAPGRVERPPVADAPSWREPGRAVGVPAISTDRPHPRSPWTDGGTVDRRPAAPVPAAMPARDERPATAHPPAQRIIEPGVRTWERPPERVVERPMERLVDRQLERPPQPTFDRGPERVVERSVDRGFDRGGSERAAPRMGVPQPTPMQTAPVARPAPAQEVRRESPREGRPDRAHSRQEGRQAE